MSGAHTHPGGRPREFDVHEALDRALLLFWKCGYEGTSLADLTQAMGISKPSLYAAFGTKEQLFRRALERYAEGPGSYASRALGEPTSRSVAEATLRGAVETTIMPAGFGGCLTVQGALVSSPGAKPAFDVLVEWRNAAGKQLEERFDRAVAEGDLPEDARPARLARFVMTLVFGIAVQAADGIGREELDEVVDDALLRWPTDA